jgi:hypothetical protein
MTPKADSVSDMDKSLAWCAIITGLAASGELSPETLAEKGGDTRVRTLCVHAANLVSHFHSEFVRANGKGTL